MLKFFRELIDSQNLNASSKTFVGLLAFLYIFISGFADLFFKLTPTEFVFFGILGLVIGVFGLNTFLTSRSIGTSKMITNVSSETVTNKIEIEATKEGDKIKSND